MVPDALSRSVSSETFVMENSHHLDEVSLNNELFVVDSNQRWVHMNY